MENDSFLIPANSKKSMLILGFFTTFDLILFSIGVGISIIGLAIVRSDNFFTMLMIVLPGLISTFLVLPVPYYHNVLQLIKNIFGFLFNNRKYYWKGWCVCDDTKKE